MKYFLDTEFHECKKQPTVCGIKVGKAVDTVELISIGIISEENKEYYAICKDFDLKAAWNSWQWKEGAGEVAMSNDIEYWLRDNVLIPILKDLTRIEYQEHNWDISDVELVKEIANKNPKEASKELERLLNRFGKTRKQIAKDIKQFIYAPALALQGAESLDDTMEMWLPKSNIEFYAYYADYDWVVFCWLFGRMVDLPKGFPMYCRDLKQIYDEKVELLGCDQKHAEGYPKQSNEHNALNDAKWNKELFNFINKL